WAKYFEGPPVSLIPIGIDTELFSPKGETASLSLERPILLQVGTLSPVKRHHLSLGALKYLSRGALLLIGECDLARTLDTQGQELGAARYLRIPRVPHHELPRYYRAADAVLFPSDAREVTGTVTLEALACGT